MGESPGRKGIPDWAQEPVKRALDQFELIGRLLHLAAGGVSSLRGMPRLVEALAELDEDESPESQERLERSAREAELAASEVDADYPLFHAQSVMSLVAALEVLAHDVLVAWLRNDLATLQSPVVSNVKVKIGEFLELEEDERVEYLAEQVEQSLSTPLKQGLSKYEDVLDVCGLAGPVDDDIRRSVFELLEVRNVLVHRQGRADRRFVSACPWLGKSVGDSIVVGHGDFVRYNEAVTGYVLEVIQRVRVRFDLSRFEPEEQPEN